MGISVRLPARFERLVSRVAKECGATKSEAICSALCALEQERGAAHPHLTPYQAMKHLIGCASGGSRSLVGNQQEVSRDASPPADHPVNAIPLDIEPLGARVHEENAIRNFDRYARMDIIVCI